MRCVIKIICPAPAAFQSPGGWARAVEANALEERMDRLLGDAFTDFTDDPDVIYERTTDRVLYVYHVPSVLPIRGSAL